ncbi:MAG: cell division protein SepF [Tissierellia bacterium]|nr:cell division protein SepF [Tissierellia bacterium]
MSNFVDKFKYFIGIDDYEENIVEDIDDDLDISTSTTTKKFNNKVVNIHTNTSMKIAIHEPLSYEEAPSIVDDLKVRKAVVVNFEQLDAGIKKQIFDFINGGLYAIEGKIQKVNKDIFILAPSNVEIDGLKDELKNRGIFPW